MRRTAALLSSHGGAGGRSIPQALAAVLVCPLSKKPLRYCEASGSLVSDAVGVSFPVVDGIPCLVPKDGRLLDDHQEKSEQDSSTGDSSG
ncbi:hypothetical protein SEVIR_9G242500v4 [Setaria viridis]|uniref:Protein preY, mitochondrial n=2 Tax=Setaria TaxID=4554 RepID=K4AH91_SETIT|nr:uncharacterized protein LOC101757823 [Setaria italica]XP_034571595.1 UPF0434 protein Mmar10_2939 [Setaria viridis]RCV42768.1 hypothetical protein SETIT_9G242600v2 [Setaria italica]RCV42769.1 hypothetical protein SETIT_9G242600v2 [Setaria italica]RCV42770.1 hypothetical protein SETIT_9G242600v2 [Setaria italica]TKV93692.1 hypothetical protein SEVIR_9G242500v2 [Setaria viridis]TKV93693.1 hypothetical protein SEVIR_9G242500v2 [Setaria viridis]